MKTILTLSLAALSFGSITQAKPFGQAGPITRVVCESVATYEIDTPSLKTPAHGEKVFTRGHRSDVHPAPNAYLLTEYLAREDGVLTWEGDQQYYFAPEKNGVIRFNFLAPWKASGELMVKADGLSATGYINQKDHITDLTCAIERK